MKRIYIMLAAAGMSLATAQAQEVTIQSHVQATNGQPVSGAIISVIGDNASALSDSLGNFSLKAESQKRLVSIKAEGFYERQLPLEYLLKKNGKAILLTPEKETLYNGKVVTPYSTEGRDLRTVSVAGLENKDFSEKQSVGGAIGNGISGLQIIEKSGMPGEGAYMNLRGIHTFNADNSPLIVINGVPYMGNTDVSKVINGYSRDYLFGYDPKDIRSITVLKGADAAFYGSLGSNGVIVIETQQATSDNLDTRISFSGQYGFNFKNGTLPVLNASQYRSYLSDLGMTRYPSMATLTQDYPFLQNGSNINSYLFNEDTDWMKDIQRNGFTTENIFRVEGGDEIAKYNISFGYTGNRGTLKNTNTNRYHTLISADVLVSRKVDIFANVGLAYINSKLNNMGMQKQTNPMLAAYQTMPLINAHAKQEDGSVLGRFASYDAWNVSSIPTYPYDNTSNPMALVETVEGADKIYDANTQLGINYKWNDFLKLTAMVNLYYNYTEETMFIPGVTSRAILPQVYGTGLNKVANGVIRQTANTYSLQGQYKRTFNKIHELNALAMARIMTNELEIDYNEGFNTANDFYKSLDQANNENKTTGSNAEWNYMTYALHGDYIYNRILKGQLGLTIDGSSVTGSDAARFGFFPSAGATAMIANMGILPSWINVLNVSLEGSITGNSRFSSNYGKNYYISRNVDNMGAITRSNMPSTKLSWEKKRQLDLGIDVSLFDGFADLGVNFYTNTSYDLLLRRDISAVYGSTNYYDNTGEISGHGLELSLRLNPLHTKDWDVVLGATFATQKSTVKSLGGDKNSIIKYTEFNSDDAQMIMSVDDEPYNFYGYKTAGIYSTTAEAKASGLVNSNGEAYEAGDVRFVDMNGDGIINESDKVSLGSSLPTAFGGFNVMVRFKQWSLNANFGYSLGNKVYNATRRQLESMDKFYNQSAAVMNRWQVEGQQASLPRASYGDPKGNNAFSDRWIEDGDYLKLRSVKLSYDFDKLFSFVRSGSVFVAAENLFTITKYLGSDPEFAYSYNENLRGFDYAKMAMPVTVKLGFNLNF